MTIRRNSMINLAGSLVGIVLFVALTPVYFHTIGSERYGILSIILAFMVFFTTFDFGMGASLTFRIAGTDRTDYAGQGRYFWTALAISTPVGAMVGAIMFGLVGGGFGHLLKLSPTVSQELMASIVPLLAIGLATVLQTTISGLYKGRECFLASAVFGALTIAASILLPVMTAIYIDPALNKLILATLVARLIILLPTLLVAQFVILKGSRPGLSSFAARQLIGYGIWASVSGLVEMFISSADRVVIGLVSGSSAVAHYAIPFGIVSRSMIVSNSLMGALFPQMVSRGSGNDLASKATDTLLLLTPLFLAGMLASPEFLRLWIGQEFSQQATLPLQILGAAFWLEMLASVPYYQLLASGQPGRNFSIALLLAMPYLGLLYLLIAYWGVAGASLVYLLRNLALFIVRTAAVGQDRVPLARAMPDAVLITAMLLVTVTPLEAHTRLVIGLGLVVIATLAKIGRFRLLLEPHLRSLPRCHISKQRL